MLIVDYVYANDWLHYSTSNWRCLTRVCVPSANKRVSVVTVIAFALISVDYN